VKSHGRVAVLFPEYHYICNSYLALGERTPAALSGAVVEFKGRRQAAETVLLPGAHLAGEDLLLLVLLVGKGPRSLALQGAVWPLQGVPGLPSLGLWCLPRPPGVAVADRVPDARAGVQLHRLASSAMVEDTFASATTAAAGAAATTAAAVALGRTPTRGGPARSHRHNTVGLMLPIGVPVLLLLLFLVVARQPIDGAF